MTQGSPCLTCEYAPPTFALNGRIRLEFTSTRTARFIHDNAPPIDVVAWMQGNPLFENRDYSGEWVVTLSRVSFGVDQFPGAFDTHQTAIIARLAPLVGPEQYEMTRYFGGAPSRPVPIEPRARRYRFTCVTPSSACDLVEHDIFILNPQCISCVDPPDRDFMTLFFNANESGEMVGMVDRGSSGTAIGYKIDDNDRVWKAYGSADRVVVRYSGTAQTAGVEPAGYSLDIEMHRLPTGLFNIAGDAP